MPDESPRFPSAVRLKVPTSSLLCPRAGFPRRRPAVFLGGLAAALLSAGCGDGGTGVPAVESVTVVPDATTLDLGSSRPFVAEARDASGSLLDVPATWGTTEPGVVSVTPSGVATALAPGTAFVTATVGGRSGYATVTSRDPRPPPAPTGIEAHPVSDVEMDVTWSDGSDRETEFRIQRADLEGSAPGGTTASGTRGRGTGQAWSTVGTVAADVTAFRDGGLMPDAAYLYRVLACNENGCSAPSDASGEVRSFPTLVIETSALPPALLDAPYAASLEASGPEGPVAWSLAGGALPAGLELSPSGTISGIPETEGTSGLTVRATAAGQVRTRDLSLPVVRLLILTAELPDARTGEAYEAALEAQGDGDGDEGDFTWEVTSGSLPPGIQLDEAAGILAGVPTSPGVFAFTMRVARGGAAGEAELRIVVDRLSVTTAVLPAGAVDGGYAVALEAAGGAGAYAWEAAAGELPPGLVLSSSGALSGAPERAGTFTFTVLVRSGDGQTAVAELEIEVDPSPVQVSTTFLVLGTLGTPYSASLETTGGDGTAYTWSVVAGTIPPGLVLDSGSGLLSGTPAEPGTFDFTVRVASGGTSDLQDLSLLVTVPPVVVEDRYLPGGYVGVPYQETPEVTGGDGSYVFSVVGGELPPGLSLHPSTGTVSGTPTAAGAHYVAIRADSYGNADVATFLLTVSGAAPGAYNVSAMTIAGSTVPSAAVVAALGEALARWEQVVVGDLPDVTYADGQWDDECGGHAPRLNGASVDDLVVMVDIRPMDGPGGILGSAGTCAVREGGPPWLPVFGLMLLDAADLAALDAEGRFALFLHEIGHVMGIGTLWREEGNTLVVGRGGPDPRYVGPSGVGEYAGYGGLDPDVAVANTGGGGTRDVHWREAVFDHEIMTGYAEDPGVSEPLSRITVGSLRDLGYTVDLGAADPYGLPGCAPVCAPPPSVAGSASLRPYDRVLDEPVWVPVAGHGPRPLSRPPGSALIPSRPPSTPPPGG